MLDISADDDLPRRGRKLPSGAAAFGLLLTLLAAGLVAFLVLVIAPSVSAAGGCGGG